MSIIAFRAHISICTSCFATLLAFIFLIINDCSLKHPIMAIIQNSLLLHHATLQKYVLACCLRLCTSTPILIADIHSHS